MIKAADQGNPPPVAGLLSSENGLRRKFDFFIAQENSLREAQPRPRTPCWKDLELHIGRTLYGATAGQFDGEQALAKINDVVERSPCSQR